MQKIKVAKKEQKPTSTGGTMVALYDEGNTRFAGFQPELKTVQEGDVVELEVEVKGKYNNITAFKVLERGLPPPIKEQESVGEQKKAWQPRSDSPEQRASIESQVAAKIIAELWIADKVDWGHALTIALEKWLTEKIGGKPITPEKLPPAPATPLKSQPGKPTEATKPFDLKKFMEEFTETRTILENAGQEKWKYEALLARLNGMAGFSSRTIPAAISKLTNEQREALAKELNEDFGKAQ